MPLKTEPANARVRIAHAGWLLDQGRAALARPEAEEAVKLDPKSPDARRLKGFIAWHLRDLDGAEAVFEPLHRDMPGDGGSANLLALTLVEQDDPVKRARGLQLAEANARQNPRGNDVLATLGWAHYRSGHLDQAEQVLRAVAQGGRTTQEVAYYLARLCRQGKHRRCPQAPEIRHRPAWRLRPPRGGQVAAEDPSEVESRRLDRPSAKRGIGSRLCMAIPPHARLMGPCASPSFRASSTIANRPNSSKIDIISP